MERRNPRETNTFQPFNADQKLSLAVSVRELQVPFDTHDQTLAPHPDDRDDHAIVRVHVFEKSRGAKEGSAIAAENEETLRRRWVDKRVSELATQGKTPDAARTQADTEFREKFGFNAGIKR
jgi:hypothetical protein